MTFRFDRVRYLILFRISISNKVFIFYHSSFHGFRQFILIYHIIIQYNQHVGIIQGYFILTYASIFIIGSKAAMLPLAFGSNRSKTKDRKKSPLCFHRDLIIGHLIWVSIGLGLHNFGFYIHNDTLQGLQRTEDIFVLLSLVHS